MKTFLLFAALLFVPLLGSAQVQEKSEIFVQLGHKGVINHVAVSPDGRLIASVGDDQNIVLWDSASARELRALTGHKGRVFGLAFSPDGRMLASGSDDRTIKLWDLATARELRTLTGHEKEVRSVAFSPDGRTLASAGFDNTLRLWDIASGQELRVFKGHYKPVFVVAFAPDGRTLASASFDETVKLWDVADGRELKTFAGHKEGAIVVAFSPDGRSLASSGFDRTIKLWDIASGQGLWTAQAVDPESSRRYYVRSLAFSPDGRSLASAGPSENAEFKLWDVATGREAKSLPNFAHAVAFSPDGRTLVSGNFSVRTWDAASGRELRAFLRQGYNLRSVVLAADGRSLVIAGADGASPVELIDLADGRKLQTFGEVLTDKERRIGIRLRAVALAPDRRTLASVNESTWKISLADVATGKLRQTFEWTRRDWLGIKIPVSWIESVAFSPDGRLLAAASKNESLIVLDAGSGRELWQLKGGDIPLILGDQDTVPNSFKFNASPVVGVVFSPDSRTLAVSSLDRSVKLRDSTTGQELQSLVGHTGYVAAMAFSPDGQTLASAGYDRSIRLWDVRSGQQLASFGGHDAPILSLAFSPDGRTLASGGMDNAIRLWDIAGSNELRTLRGHQFWVLSLAFSPDGSALVSGSRDSTARIWDWRSGKERVAIIPFADGSTMAITPEGYFSASSAKLADVLNIRRGLSVYGVDQFYDVFYRPDIVEAALAGQDTSRLAALSIDEALNHPPPTVEAVEVAPPGAAAKARVAYRIRSAGGGIGDVRVFHNGKLVYSDGQAQAAPAALLGKSAQQVTGEALAGQMRRLAAEAGKSAPPAGAVVSRPKPERYEASLEIEPVPGDNDIAVVAFNAQNSIQSVAKVASFTSSQAPQPARLYLLAIGIDDYKDKSVRLTFAGKDARDLGARWRMQAAALYGEGNVVIETLANAQATRAGILAKIGQMAARVRPTDHFVLFVASHGVLLGDQYYVVTHDYDGNLQPAKLISANEIVDFSKRVKALSQLYILDTCHAGGLEGVVAGLYDARVSVLARRMGLHVFASASSAQEALDGFEGNGLFTHTLLAGLADNPQADSNADRQVSIAELGGYAKGRTRDIASRLKHRQEPLILQFGQDRTVYKLQ